MSISYQRDGSIVLGSDINPTITQTLPPGQTSVQVAAAYASFLIQNPQPVPPLDPITNLDNEVATLQAQVAALEGPSGQTGVSGPTGM